MSSCEALPAAECFFNFLALVFTLTGVFLIKKGRRQAHKQAMLAAVVASAIFLTLYLIYHASCPPLPYLGNFGIIYYPFLILHIVLAAFVPLLVLKVLWHAFKDELDKHRRLARLTVPIWIYVSASGMILYFWLKL